MKPENLLLVDPNQSNIKLADFGLAAIIKGDELLTKAVGTPGNSKPKLLFFSNLTKQIVRLYW